MRIRVGEDFAAFLRSVADEKDGTFRQQRIIAARFYDFRFDLRQLPCIGGEDGRIDFHPAGVDHRDDGRAPFREQAPVTGLPDQRIQ